MWQEPVGSSFRVPCKSLCKIFRGSFGIFFFAVSGILLLGFFPSPLSAFSLQGKPVRFYYLHRTNSGKITGYTEITYSFPSEKSTEIFEEHSKLVNAKGVFSEYHNQFDTSSLKIIQSSAEDYRNGMKIETNYSGQTSKTEWQSNSEKDNFFYNVPKNAIVFEEINLFFIRNFEKLENKTIKEIKVFFPQILFELKKRGLPSGLSTFSFKVQKKKEITHKFDGKKIKGMLFELKPSSFLVKMLLPEDKQKFTFLVQNDEVSRKVLEFFDGEVTYIYSKKKPEEF